MSAAPESPAGLEERYRIAPQLRVYDSLLPVLRPYVAFSTQADFDSPVATTDSLGFRRSRHGGEVVDSSSWRDGDGIVLGGSFAFGVGATRDSATVPSELMRLTGRRFLNLGIRAGNSTQELIAAIPFVRRASATVVLSGMNNLVVAIQSLGVNELYGPLFVEGALARLGRRPLRELTLETVDMLPGNDVASVLARELRRRTQAKLSRLAGRPRRRAASGGAASSLDPARVAHAAELALDRHERDLHLIAAAASDDADVLFAIQPYARPAARVPATEEKRLFAITDDLQNIHWQVLKTALDGIWPEYVERLGAACARLGVRSLDLNDDEYGGWCFVDRAHMTDLGYTRTAELIAEALAR